MLLLIKPSAQGTEEVCKTNSSPKVTIPLTPSVSTGLSVVVNLRFLGRSLPNGKSLSV
jgi:hypothetical protein